ncbi:hypothetical protein LVISKB_0801 [Levilactobacillus brevis KB290]|uniref:Uncharacterized protein n=1 Tax=Levilactobacillus brevis KB290 TaxID=1001583 RepID=M5AZ72_LEVBR|nr:hypothetical protein LVISKB_0801 [Levilactobacillus brevis KB290]
MLEIPDKSLMIDINGEASRRYYLFSGDISGC